MVLTSARQAAEVGIHARPKGLLMGNGNGGAGGHPQQLRIHPCLSEGRTCLAEQHGKLLEKDLKNYGDYQNYMNYVCDWYGLGPLETNIIHLKKSHNWQLNLLF